MSMALVILAAALAAAIVVIALLASRLSSVRVELVRANSEADNALMNLDRAERRHADELAALKAENAAALQEQKAEFAAAAQAQKAEFAAAAQAQERRFAELAAKALADNSEQLRRQNRNGLAEVLAPVKEQLETFSRDINERYGEEAKRSFALDRRVGELIELNNVVRSETRRLSDALRGNTRMQGDWGEMILDNILRSAGFREGHEYTLQVSSNNEEGRRLRPDVVINYADDRKIIIDSKVSIQDYIKMLNADSEDERRQFARAHVASVRKHIAELRSKRYQDLTGADSPDYVLMFIPHEGAFLAALDIDKSLWETASESHVLIISPTHLMAVIKLIEQMWRQDRQNANALAIAEEASKLLDKLSGFLTDMDTIDKSINAARRAWDGACAKLSTGRGSVMRHASRMQQLGAKAAKGIPNRYVPDMDEDEPMSDEE